MLLVLKRTVSNRDGSFENPKHVFKLTSKKLFVSLRSKILLIKTMITYIPHHHHTINEED